MKNINYVSKSMQKNADLCKKHFFSDHKNKEFSNDMTLCAITKVFSVITIVDYISNRGTAIYVSRNLVTMTAIKRTNT